MARERPGQRRVGRPLPPPSNGFVAVGFVTAPRGLRGELTVVPLTDFPERFQPGAQLWARGTAYTVRHTRTHRGRLLVELEGIESRTEAEALRDVLLEVPEQELPPLAEDQYFRFDVVGMEVVDESGRALGRLDEVLETGANDVYIVRDDSGELLIPAIDSVIKRVDVKGRRMVVAPLAGLERRARKPPKRP